MEAQVGVDSHALLGGIGNVYEELDPFEVACGATYAYMRFERRGLGACKAR